MSRASAYIAIIVAGCFAGYGASAGEDSALPDTGQATDEFSIEEYTVEEFSHWSLLKRSSPVPPDFSDESDRQWVRNSVDAFVLSRLKAAGLRPAPPADRRTLIRRVYFDLTGLPPAASVVQRFADDESPAAYRNLIDELLATAAKKSRDGRYRKLGFHPRPDFSLHRAVAARTK